MAALASDFPLGMRWSPDTGDRIYWSLNTSAAKLRIKLAPYESEVFAFYTDGTIGTVFAFPPVKTLNLSSDWKLEFTASSNSQPESVLTDWIANPATLHYSGEGVYSRDFTLSAVPTTATYLEVDGGAALPGAPDSPPEHGSTPGVIGPDGLPNPLITRPGPGMHAYFDPPLHEAALVFINGQPAGALWHPPYRLDISKLLKPGTNHIEIHVYNTALNAWSALPPRDYKPLIEKYGDRFQMQDFDKVRPIPSGILGTIKLVTETP